ncbi:MAG: hypothetical protein O2887_00205 [Bacteroidetes bacterium]|nr:hypothetical protein [Bacteroidota bacterium]MDA1118911.1 hypothetical protein [Bacteroidota bacterium]
MKKLMIIGLIAITGYNVMSQRDPSNIWNWPEDRAAAEEKYVLHNDNVSIGEFEEAIEPLEWLIKEAPDLNPAIYINGAKIYEFMAENESDEIKKIEYQEKALEMYDSRIKYFNNEASVLNRKAFTAYKYYKNMPSKYIELKELFDRAFELNGLDIFDNNLIAYMDIIRRYKAAGNEISDEEVLDIYAVITNLIKKKEGGGRLESIADNVDKILAATITVDCDFVENNFGPKLQENIEDIKLAKNIFQLMLSGKCTDSPLAIQAAEIIQKADPSYGIAKFIAARSQADGNIKKALKYYGQAVDLAELDTKRGETYLDMARLYAANGQESTSRTYAQKAIGENSQLKDAYSLIGDLYMYSAKDCKEGISRVKDRVIYIAAYDMYSRAGDMNGMANALEQFPSMEDIFNENLEIGNEISVGCWINVTVKLDRRPAN